MSTSTLKTLKKSCSKLFNWIQLFDSDLFTAETMLMFASHAVGEKQSF